MRILRLGYGVRGFGYLARMGHLWRMTPKDAKRRLEILRFFDRYGLQATIEAFGVSRRTVYRWKARLKAAGGDPSVLAARSSAPLRRRKPETPREVVERIRELRKRYPNLGKAKVHVLLAPWCAENGLPCPSVSTIGRIIARAPDRMRVTPRRLDRNGRARPVKRKQKLRKPKNMRSAPLHLWACDTIERVRDGIRRYVITFLDPTSRIAFAIGLPSKASKNTTAALAALLDGMSGGVPGSPSSSRTLAFLSDNGSEFMGAFDALLAEKGIPHYWTYPKSPKMNAHNERFNRTIQDQFIDHHEELLFSALLLFNHHLALWLIDYNTKIPHHALGLKSPLQWLLDHHPECQRYWTHTVPGTGPDGEVCCQEGDSTRLIGSVCGAPGG